MKSSCLIAAIAIALGLIGQASAQSFTKDVEPFLGKYCVGCHQGPKAKAKVRLDGYENLMANKKKVVVAGEPDKSLLVTCTEGESDPKMPPESKKQPSEKEIKVLRAWVKAGAKDDGKKKAALDNSGDDLVAVAFQEPAAVKLKEGDRIVFLGDSITAGGNGGNGYINVIRKHLAAKKPDLKVECIGAGISGNKVPDLQRRVERDVIAKKPTIVVVYIGINDVWHGENDPKRGTDPEAFEAGLKEVLGKIEAAGARVVLCTPTVIGEFKDGKNKNDAKLDAYSDISRRVAKEGGRTLCDLRKAFVENIAKTNEKNAERGILTGDRVHLNDAGNRLVAETILKSLGE
jgi:lysophospholipase L1-like esterase